MQFDHILLRGGLVHSRPALLMDRIRLPQVIGPQFLGDVRRDGLQDALLDARLAHEADPPLRQVPQTAVQEPARTAACAVGEVVLLDEGVFTHVRRPQLELESRP